MQLASYSEPTPIFLTPRGTVTIPKKIRDKAGLKGKSLLFSSLQNGKIILEPVSGYSYPVRSYTNEEIQEFLRQDQDLNPKVAKKLYQKFSVKLDVG